MQKWEQPKVVRLDALPDVLGKCGTGGSVVPICSVGQRADTCSTGAAVNQQQV